ncbi:MAG: SH3 domain-containing protein [Candidatus Aminicenantes bacterium]|nr:SH3 domain-containing protein [Candidatus Aminicenantes bacterium]
MKQPALRVCLSAALLLVVPLAAAASGGASKLKVEVVVATANVRSAPTMTGSIITRLSKGTVLEAEKAEGAWFKVKLPPDKVGVAKVGYMHQSVVKVIEEPESAPAAPPAPAPKAGKAAARPSAPGAPAKKKFEFSLLGGAGLTAVDVAKDLEIEEEYLEDWDKFHWRIAAQAIYRLKPNLGVGLEVGFQSLYYFYYIYPYTEGQDAYRENTVTATTVSGLVDIRLGRYFFAQALAGVAMYEDSTLFSVGGALGGEFPINAYLAVPVMARVDFVPGGPSPAALVVGLKVKI